LLTFGLLELGRHRVRSRGLDWPPRSDVANLAK
jgi:hypothetical protein